MATLAQQSLPDVMTSTEQSARTIVQLLTLAGVPDIDSDCCSVGTRRCPLSASAARVDAHVWVTTNWQAVRSMMTKNSMSPLTPPALSAPAEWLQCAKRVIKAKLGLGLVPQRNAAKGRAGWTHTLTVLGFWAKIGLDIPGYVEWLQGPDRTAFGISPMVRTSCDLCNGAGDDSVCVSQGGLWRCVVSQGGSQVEHRVWPDPLDVGTLRTFHRLANLQDPQDGLQLEVVQEEEEEEEVKDEVLPVGASAALDPFLSFLGFPEGVKSKQSVSDSEMRRCVDNNAPPTERVQAQLRQDLGLEPSWSMDPSMGLVAIRKRLAAVLTKTGYQLERPRKQIGGSRQRATCITLMASKATESPEQQSTVGLNSTSADN
jgi:hypothetical protein